MNYPEDHPLHGRDIEWIAARAEHVSKFTCTPPHGTGPNIRLIPASFAALAHEYKRLTQLTTDMESPWSIEEPGKDHNGPEVFARRAMARINAFRNALGGGTASDEDLIEKVRKLCERVEAAETELARESSRRADWYMTAMEADDKLCEYRARIKELGAERDKDETEVRNLKSQLAAWQRTCESDTDDAHDRRAHAKERSREYPDPPEPETSDLGGD